MHAVLELCLSPLIKCQGCLLTCQNGAESRLLDKVPNKHFSIGTERQSDDTALEGWRSFSMPY